MVRSVHNGRVFIDAVLAISWLDLGGVNTFYYVTILKLLCSSGIS